MYVCLIRFLNFSLVLCCFIILWQQLQKKYKKVFKCCFFLLVVWEDTLGVECVVTLPTLPFIPLGSN